MLADAAGLIALFGEQREDALYCLQQIQESSFPIYVTTAVVAETHRRLLYGFGAAAARRFLAEVPGTAYLLVDPSREDLEEARAITERYPDQSITLCDALSFTLMKRLGILQAFTYDHRHFWLMGFLTVPPLVV